MVRRGAGVGWGGEEGRFAAVGQTCAWWCCGITLHSPNPKPRSKRSGWAMLLYTDVFSVIVLDHCRESCTQW